MTGKIFGYSGKLLRVDLSAKKTGVPMPETLQELGLGELMQDLA